ncbi:MAG: sensor histidine kinase [Fibrobacteria bacterium]|nr:sensor histidine kinase [Fibrobacteria bacterium]
MSIVSQFIVNHMVLVYFFYGLSFFSLGISILTQTRKGSAFNFGANLWLLGLFGLLHGFNEWMDMLLLLGESYWSTSGVTILENVRFFLGKISYIFLFEFGLQTVVVSELPKRKAILTSVSMYAFLVAVLFWKGISSGFSAAWFANTDLFMRYVFAFPGALLTGLSFFLQKKAREITRLKEKRITHWFSAAAVLFVLYAVLSGLIVKGGNFFPATVLNYSNFIALTGVPVQIFRACCAFGILYYLLRILHIFEMEKSQKLKEAYEEVLKISTREQERIGQEIHDGLCQQLTGILFNTQMLEKKMEQAEPGYNEELHKLNGYLNDAISDARRMSKHLFPVEIEKHGLVFAIREFCQSISVMHNVVCKAEIEDTVELKDHMKATHLFRIAQEAIHNTVKHAGASAITVTLADIGHGILELVVTDNGMGIADADEQRRGMGITIMHYRAKVLEGTLRIEGNPNEGTKVICRITST